MTGTGVDIPWFNPEMTGGEQELLRQVLDSNFINDGPVTRRFEQKIARIAGTKYAVAVTSGTIAITCALLALGIGAGDEVLVPDFTFIATANAVRLTGATPILVDVETRRFCIDIEAAAAARTERSRAIVSVDVNGRGAAYDLLEPFCANHGLALVTDSSEALGSWYRGRPLGSYGQAGCFSFSASKFVTTGQGGVVTTSDEALYRRLIEIKDQGRPVRGSGGDDLHPTLGFNFKFTDLQAAVGIAQLEALDQRIAASRRRDAVYLELLGNVPGIQLGDMQEEGEARLWGDALIEQRGKVEAALKAEGIGYRNFWFPIHSQAAYSDQAGKFAGTTHVSRNGLWLPSHFSITEADIERTCDVIRRALL
ncbi:MAG: DegT/DnrJ/EryC1/StrS family aminotransferase [Ferrovibrio sp.]